MFFSCQKDMIVKNMGSALRFCIPQMIGRKLGEFWELMKPLVDFKYEVGIYDMIDHISQLTSYF